MGWVLRITGSIIALFILAALVGFFMPSHVTAERSILLKAAPEDVFPYFSDLNDYAQWNPWQGSSPAADYVVGGSDRGVGQQGAWTCQATDCLPGTQIISVVQPPELVKADLNLQGRDAVATYAVQPSGNADGRVMVLMQVKYDVGGFPYVQRLIKSRRLDVLNTHIDQGLARLAQQFETAEGA